MIDNFFLNTECWRILRPKYLSNYYLLFTLYLFVELFINPYGIFVASFNNASNSTSYVCDICLDESKALFFKYVIQ